MSIEKISMVSVQKALELIEARCIKKDSINLPLMDSLGFVLAEDVISSINMPPFNQSAMDGYAVALHEAQEYTLIGEVKAGDNSHFNLKKGEAVRIFTGAMVPEGSDCVAKQEIVERLNDHSIRISTELNPFGNIRPLGEQIKSGDTGLKKGTYLNTGAIGFAAMLGITEVLVYNKPKIAIIATGSELTKPGQPLPNGAIYESNTFTLLAALRSSNFDASIGTVDDNYNSTKSKIEKAIQNNDVVLVTGGISVGDYDFVGDILTELEVTEAFYKIKQKPGKPMYFGHKAEKLIFALPGNPASALSCYYNYALPALNLLSGKTDSHLEKRTFTLQSNYKKTVKMTHFLKGYAQGENVQILGKQSSAMLNSFIDGNCLIVLEEGRESWQIGDKVQALIIPQ